MTVTEDRRRLGADMLPSPVAGLVGLRRVPEPGEEQSGLIRLNRNERLEPLPGWFMDALHDSLDSSVLAGYPVTDGLHRDLAASLGVPVERLLLTPGSDAAIKALFEAYIRAGDTVVMLDPGYAMADVYARMFQARTIKIPFNESLELDYQRLLDSVTKGIRLVLLANPNQPTATMLPPVILEQLAERSRVAGALLAIDEAYYPFSGWTVLPWLADHPELLVLRTFSKAAGLAGLRIGYVVGHEEVVGNMYKVHAVHDINSVAVLAARLVVKHPEVISEYVAQVAAGAKVLAERASALGLRAFPTHTNFMLLDVVRRIAPATLVERLYRRRYLVKGPFHDPCLANCVRITLGPPSLMSEFADVLAAALVEEC